jgi:uncharacterized membrane protein
MPRIVVDGCLPTLAINILINKGAKCISYMHLVNNNVVPLVLGAFVIVGKISIKEVTTHLLWDKPRHLSQGTAATKDPMHASHVINPTEATSTNQKATHGHHKD